MLNARISKYRCTREVWRARRKRNSNFLSVLKLPKCIHNYSIYAQLNAWTNSFLTWRQQLRRWGHPFFFRLLSNAFSDYRSVGRWEKEKKNAKIKFEKESGTTIPDKRVGTRSKFSPPPLSMLIIRWFLPFLLEKTRSFPTLIRGEGGYKKQLKCPNYFWPGL